MICIARMIGSSGCRPFCPFEEAATLPCAAVTAWVALTGHRRVTAGDTVLIQGSGGVSVFGLQFARMLGAQVIATTSTAEKAERLKALGASDVINYTETPDWDAKVRELTDGRGVDCIVEIGRTRSRSRW
jgi:NADPH:quinone reductase-like Zn-dependent oxidoreductase